MVKFLFIFLILLSNISHASLRIHLGPNPAYKGEQITLTIEADNIDQNAQPDLSVLKKDFRILGQSSSQQIQIINGSRSDKRTWVIKLLPLKDGLIYIPEIPVGNEKTTKATLSLQDIPKEITQKINNAVSIETEIIKSNNTQYVQQEISLVVRLVFTDDLIEGSLSEVNIENAVTEKLGKDTRYSGTKNGKEVQVIERRYSIFPEKSGALVIPAFTLQGKIKSGRRVNQQRRSSSALYEQFFGRDPFQQAIDPGRPISVRSKPINLDIQPRPKSFKGKYWIPSKELTIEDSWSKKPPVFKTGVPVNRTITITAEGLGATQLPEFEFLQPENFRLYNDQAKISSHTDGKNVFGEYSQTLTYLPSVPGVAHIPEVSFEWWNTKTDQSQKTTIPAWQLTVTGEGIISDTKPTPTDPVSKVDDILTTENTSAATDNIATKNLIEDKHNTLLINASNWLKTYWLYLILAIFIVLIISIFSYKKLTRIAATRNKQKREQQLINYVVKSAKEKNPAEALNHLLKLAQFTWTKTYPTNLHELKKYLPEQQMILNELDRVLYGGKNHSWNTEEFINAFKDGFNTPVKNLISDEIFLHKLYHGQ